MLGLGRPDADIRIIYFEDRDPAGTYLVRLGTRRRFNDLSDPEDSGEHFLRFNHRIRRPDHRAPREIGLAPSIALFRKVAFPLD